MKIFNYLQEYKREKPVNQQDKLIQTHYPQTEHSPKTSRKGTLYHMIKLE